MFYAFLVIAGAIFISCGLILKDKRTNNFGFIRMCVELQQILWWYDSEERLATYLKKNPDTDITNSLVGQRLLKATIWNGSKDLPEFTTLHWQFMFHSTMREYINKLRDGEFKEWSTKRLRSLTGMQ